MKKKINFLNLILYVIYVPLMMPTAIFISAIEGVGKVFQTALKDIIVE